MKKLISMAIVFGMLAVSFAMVTPQNAKADFIEVLAGAPWGGTFTPYDVAFSDDGHFGVMVGHESTVGSNVWGLNVLTDTWFPISGAPLAQSMTSVCYDSWSDVFLMGGDAGGSNTVYNVIPGDNFLNSLGHSTPVTAIAVSDVSGILVGGTNSMYATSDWMTWYPYTLGSPYTVRSITYNTYDQRFYVTTYDSGSGHAAVFYSDIAPLNAGSMMNLATLPGTVTELRGIEWNPIHNYGLAVGTGVYKIFPYIGAPILDMEIVAPGTPFESFYDVAWDTDGWNEAAIFGQNVTITQAVYYRYYHTNPTLILGWQEPTHTIYRCGGIKPPGSPKMVFAPAPNGGIVANIQALDQSTRLTANAVFPKLYWIGFNDTAYNNRLDQQVAPDTNYLFTLEANYSVGWTNCEVVIQAWHDAGNTFGASVYPAEVDAYRNLAFRFTYDALTGLYDVAYPAGDTEFTDIAVTETEIMTPFPVSNPENNRRLAIEIDFGPQARMADYTGLAPGGPQFGMNPLTVLNNPNSWDFSVTVRDRVQITAVNTSYAEFGIQTASSVVVTGNPSGNAPPGTLDNPMTTNSQITYSSNAPYFVNVSIPDLLRNGVGPASILATAVSVQNVEPRANVGNSAIPAQSYFAGPNMPLYVWGLNLAPMPPLGNGTVSNADYISDYNAAANAANAYTELSWWVSVAGGTPEGIYWAVITISIENY